MLLKCFRSMYNYQGLISEKAAAVGKVWPKCKAWSEVLTSDSYILEHTEEIMKIIFPSLASHFFFLSLGETTFSGCVINQGDC